MEIEVQAFLKDGQKSPGKLLLFQDYLEIKCAHTSENWTYKDISCEVGGAANKLIFVNNPKSLHLSSFYFQRNKENLKMLEALAGAEFLDILQRSKQHSIKFYTSLGAAVLGLVLMIFLFTKIWAPTLELIAESVPYSLEKELGDRIVGLVVPKNKLFEQVEIQRLLEGQVNRLTKNLPEEMQDIKIYISQDGDINAFALPGGHIIFNRGLLENARSIEEVLGVAAHELAHVRQRHSLKSLIKSLGLFLGVDLLIGDISGIIAVLADNSQLLIQRGFSREYELESDNIGLQILLKAQVSPQGLLDFFQTLKKYSNQDEEFMNSLSFLSTHPGIDDRIENLTHKIEEGNYDIPPLNFDYNRFKNLLTKKEGHQ